MTTKLRPSTCPVKTPDDLYRLVSTADCDFIDFESVSEATRLYIKGHKFTIVHLLGDAYKHEAERYTGGPGRLSRDPCVGGHGDWDGHAQVWMVIRRFSLIFMLKNIARILYINVASIQATDIGSR
ncbi:Phosphatidylserine decarboxylase proenzyme 2 [Mycena venus]|uniref:Phosphatidylserine decarboxylase proenzyme 2 n=1 Tax=Mycena venus TaxID=2733690 RepID=A0A8H7DGV4_9AGAR|nr:Phosphatidylserine decarboxylase proenzyme 2 [Mycena venus]